MRNSNLPAHGNHEQNDPMCLYSNIHALPSHGSNHSDEFRDKMYKEKPVNGLQEGFPQFIEFKDGESLENLSRTHNLNLSEFECAEHALHKLHVMSFNDELWLYEHPRYKLVTQDEAIAVIKELFDNGLLKRKQYSFWVNVYRHIKSTKGIRCDEIRSNYKVNEIVFRNGVYNIQNETFRKATPEDKYTSFNDVEFHPGRAEESKFVDDVFDDMSGKDSEILCRIWMALGCLLSVFNLFRKFFLLVGPPATSKSLLGHLAESLVGFLNISHIPLKKLSEKYYAANLDNKQLNTCLDLSLTEIKDIELLKLLTSGLGDTVQVEGKYSTFFTLKTDKIKLLFASNKIPRVSKSEYAQPYYDRMLLIPMLNQIPEEKRDRMLLKKLLQHQDYIILKALRHYKILVDNNLTFPPCKAAEIMLEKHLEKQVDTI